MKLKDYLKKQKLTCYAFAKKIGVTPWTVQRYIEGQHIPDRKHMQAIHDVTNGKVGPADFYNL